MAVFGYYRYFLLSDLEVRTALLLGLAGALAPAYGAKELKALQKTLGITFILISAGLGAVLAFSVGEYVLPFSEQRQERFRNEIYGRPPDEGGRGPGVSNWYLAENDEIWHRETADAGSQELFGVSVFTFDKHFRLVRRTAAHDAVWSDGA